MTTPLFKKMNLKDQKQILVLHAPSSFDKELKALKNVKVLRSATGLKEIDFAIAFVIKEAELNSAVRTLSKLANSRLDLLCLALAPLLALRLGR